MENERCHPGHLEEGQGRSPLWSLPGSLIAPQKNPTFMRYFADKLKGREKEKGIGTKMRVKLAARMLVIAWTLMKKKEAFNPGCIK